MSERAIAWAAGQDFTCRTAQGVLLTLAQSPNDGGLCISTMDLYHKVRTDYSSEADQR